MRWVWFVKCLLETPLLCRLQLPCNLDLAWVLCFFWLWLGFLIVMSPIRAMTLTNQGLDCENLIGTKNFTSYWAWDIMVPKLCDRYEFVYALINDFPHLKFTLNGGIDNIHQVCLFLHLFYKVVPLKTFFFGWLLLYLLQKNSKKFNPYPMSDKPICWPGYCLKIANSRVYLECNICCDYQFFSSIQNLKLWMVIKSVSDNQFKF